MSAPRLTISTAGYCKHPEHVVLQNWKFGAKTFPAMFALVEHPTEGAILFDTGYAPHFARETATYPGIIYGKVTPFTLQDGQSAVEQLRSRGIQPKDVRYVVISHFHGDHVAGIADFPDANYVYFPEAYNSIKEKRGLKAVLSGILPGLIPDDFDQRSKPADPESLRALPPEMLPFKYGVDLFGDGYLWAVPLPGHCKGQMGLLVRDQQGLSAAKDVFLVADSCWATASFTERRMPHPVTRLLFDNMREYEATLNSLADLHAGKSNVFILPSHCTDALEQVGAWPAT